jgi:hypothetical protein
MATSINTIKSWFTTGKFPTQAQFWAWLDSFRHKDEAIPVAEISGLNQLLDLKADSEKLTNHNSDENAHPALLDMLGLKENAANKSTTTTLGTSNVLFPTQNAVKKYVDSKIPSKISDTTTYTSTATLALQILSILEIPANAFANYDIVNFKALFTKLTEFGSCNIWVHVNNSPSVIGASILYKHNGSINPTTNVILFDQKIGVLKDNKLVTSFEKGSGINIQTQDHSNSSNSIEIDFDRGITNYVIVTCELGTVDDVINQQAILIEKIN